MRLRFLLPGFIFVLAGAVLAAADKRDDQKDLQGEWVLLKIEKDGKEQSANILSPDYFRMKFDGDKITVQFQGPASEKGTYTLDLGKTPKAIDIKPLTIDKGKTILGIYELTADGNDKDKKVKDKTPSHLKLCVAEAGAPKRPTEFKSVKDQITVYHLLRLKSPEPLRERGPMKGR